MAWTSHSLRFVSALCVALIAYTAIPHFHADLHPGHEARPQSLEHTPAPAPRLSPDDSRAPDDSLTVGDSLAPDDSHDSHSSNASVDSHPCALCRGQIGRGLAATAPAPPRLEDADDRGCEPAPAASHAERIFARRHPARGPPLA
jgi:hypothetical protein